jgi:hypothetical protein
MRRTAVLVLSVLALTGCGGNKGTPTASLTAPPPTPSNKCGVASFPAAPSGTTLVAAVVTGTKVTTAHTTWDVKKGSPVRIVVVADRADEVHVHGYDKKQATVPGCPTVIDFTASIPGSVEVELEKAGLHLFDLKAS